MQRPGSISGAATCCKSGVRGADRENQCTCACCNEISLATISDLGPGGAVAVKQRVGRDGQKAHRRECRDAQGQSQLQIDGARAVRHDIKGL